MSWGQGPTRREFVRGLGLGAVALSGIGASGLLSACVLTPGPGGAADDAASGSAVDPEARMLGGNLRFAARTPYGIDPLLLCELSGIQIASLLFEPLLRYDQQKQELVSAAAASWSVSDDGRVFTFKLCEGMTFHNGAGLVAGDFKYSWERLCRPVRTVDDAGQSVIFENAANNAAYIEVVQGARAMLAGEATHISGIKALDDLTLEVSLEEPYFDFLKLVCFPALAPVLHTAERGRSLEYAARPIGNGPFKLAPAPTATSATANGELHLERFEGFHGTHPRLGSLDFVFYSDDPGQDNAENILQSYEAKTYRALETGDVDVARVPAAHLEAARAELGEALDGRTIMPGQQLACGSKASVQYLKLNTNVAPLNDLRVRQAINQAIDREALCAQMLDNATPATDIVPLVVKGGRDEVWAEKARNVEAAKRLLSAYNLEQSEPSRTLTLLMPSSSTQLELYALIEANLEEAGFIVRPMTPMSAEEAEAAKLQPTIELTGWIADFLGMDNFLVPLFGTGGLANTFGYANAEFEAQVAQARATKVEHVRQLLYQGADDIVARDLPVIPLYCPNLNVAASGRVSELYVGADELIDMTSTWVTT